ncbi:MAG: ABC transporter ATP-binding protein [Ruminococcus callidus]|uniref:ABC transporter ATP-binding protein n=1 Tax=Ruminococcus callidus TaxID=40519 RepID=UPI002E762651|nr:ABC transporter ATP-binding protein [Ruminococcus callidus]MEE0505685.1 ABC transporter ATP-binding protein [Ruminococcus callidus]
MGKLFKNLKPYWSSVLLILVLLVVQAFCDLSLPQYTSDIIDTGIQNSGVEHILPEQITAEEFENAQLFMTESEKQKWQNAYDGEQRKESLSGKDLDELDSDLLVPVLLNYQMSMMSEDSFREMLAQQQTDPNAAAQMEQMTVEELGAAMGVELQPFQRTEEDSDGNSSTVTCVDVRPVFAAMQQSGQLNEDTVTQMRSQLEDMLDTMGDSLVQSMGVAYAVQCDKDAGLDIDKIQTSYLWRTGSKMMAMAFAMMAAAICVCYVASRVGAGVGRDLRGKVFSRVMQFSSAEMDQFSTASLITRSTNDIQQVQMVTAIFLRMLLYAPILGIGGVLKVVHTGAGMGWVIVLAVLVILGIVGVLMAIAMPKFQKMQVLVDKVNLVSREILTGLSVIRAFGREKTEEERFDKANRDLTKTNLFVNRVMTFMMPVMMLIMYSLTILIVWVGSHRIDGGSMQVGSMTAFITYAMMIVMSFLMLTMMSVMLPRGSVAAKRIDEVLQTKTSVQETAQPKHLQDSKGVLTFDHVCFRYPHAEENALTDLCFTAKPNQTTAIIGSTGCGKSTLVNLIPRLYDVTAGSITLDGVELRDLPLEELRQQIGFVPQKGVLFSGTIASNLRFGNPDASDAEVQQAAEIAQAMEFIQEKPDRFDSTIAQGGTNVSGGQKQRLTIARAIAKHPKVFVFDDSFSALDLKTDAALRKALGEQVQDSTMIIVAQRISTILHADQILVLEEGKIVGKGTHEELLKNCEVYQQIAKSQLSPSELGLEGTPEEGAMTDGE